MSSRGYLERRRGVVLARASSVVVSTEGDESWGGERLADDAVDIGGARLLEVTIRARARGGDRSSCDPAAVRAGRGTARRHGAGNSRVEGEPVESFVRTVAAPSCV